MEYLNYEIFGLANGYQLLIIIHLIGLAIGAGAAFFSDFLFMHIMKDRKITKDQFAILKLASRVVWIGLLVIIASGLLIFFGNTEAYTDASKFWAKMTIVTILTINGLVFHFMQIPKLSKLQGKDLTKSRAFKEGLATPFFIGGAISGVSWVAAIVLGSLSSLDLSYIQIMYVYVGVIGLAIGASLKLKSKLFGN